ncbi:MAG TPA: D-ribose pyranase [Anaerolineaceae bacterium]|nr:D-ribose pyranase [Anaerolineaceae bacterium]
MKKTTLLNTALSETISTLGHTDTLVIGDAGLPIPDGPRRIDLALCPGVPSFLDTLRAVLSEMQVQEVIVASETAKRSPQILQGIRDLLPGVPIQSVPHEELKLRTRLARAMVRTGEFTPYANIILVAGVVF